MNSALRSLCVLVCTGALFACSTTDSDNSVPVTERSDPQTGSMLPRRDRSSSDAKVYDKDALGSVKPVPTQKK